MKHTTNKTLIIKSFIYICFLIVSYAQAQATSPQLEPPHWYVGMNVNDFQLVIHQKNIGQWSQVTLPDKVWKLQRIVRPSNPNYLILHIQINPDAREGKYVIWLQQGKKKKQISYTLNSRSVYQRLAFNERDLMYLLMPDRFANGDPSNDIVQGMQEKTSSRDSAYSRHGGDLAGVLSHLSYLKSMGISSLWLNPVYTNDQPRESYHGYAITNHYQVDPRLGDSALYRLLSRELHRRDMKLVKDVVFNHIGDRHHLFADLIDSSWFHWNTPFQFSNFRATLLMDPYASPEQKKQFDEGWFDHHMPDLHTDNDEVAQYLIQQTIWWLEEFDPDALRVDTYAYPGLAFMERWNRRIQTEYPGLFVFGEIWEHQAGVQAFFNPGSGQGSFGTVPYLTDFQLCWALLKSMNEKTGWTEGSSAIYYTLAQDYLYQDPSRQVTFIDNHDIARALGVFQGDTSKLHSALKLLMVLRGIPCILYGTEQLQNGTANHDIIRQEMKGGWEKEAKVNDFADSATFQLIKTLAEVRRHHPAFGEDARKINFIPLHNCYAFARVTDGHGVLVIMNGSGGSIRMTAGKWPGLFAGNSLTLKDPISLERIGPLQEFDMNAFEVKVLIW